MGREVRMVPVDWEHPRTSKADGRYLPLEHMPDWSPEDRTHYQMYETCSEGTPISPVMETPEKLARWLADNRASSFARATCTYEQWLGMIRGSKYSLSAAVTPGGSVVSGVELESRNASVMGEP